jgi:succinyl-CoA synthetase alpha subunit
MRLNASGSLFLGENAPGAVTPSGSQVGTAFAVGNYPYILNSVADASTRYHHQFFNSNGSVGIISTNGSNTTYATSSDYRLKENVN